MKITTEQMALIEKFIRDTDAQELRVELGDMKLLLTRDKGITVYRQVPIDTNTPKQVPAVESEDDIVPVLAPSAGIFYRKPEPDAPCYVEKGSFVEAGDTIGLIEVMKTYGQVVSEVDGYVVDILAEDGTPVEYGQKLFLIKKGVR
jgi:oxaloacetate decarboxylase alpha subunit